MGNLVKTRIEDFYANLMQVEKIERKNHSQISL